MNGRSSCLRPISRYTKKQTNIVDIKSSIKKKSRFSPAYMYYSSNNRGKKEPRQEILLWEE